MMRYGFVSTFVSELCELAFPILSCWNVPCLLVLVFFWDSAGLKPQPAFKCFACPP